MVAKSLQIYSGSRLESLTPVRVSSTRLGCSKRQACMSGGCRERRRTALGDATLLDELAGSSGSCGTPHIYSASPHPTLVRTPCLIYWQKRLQKFPPSSTMGCISIESTHIKRLSAHILGAMECQLVLTCGGLLLVCVWSCVPGSIRTKAQAMAAVVTRCSLQCELHPLMTKAPKTRPPRTNQQ